MVKEIKPARERGYKRGDILKEKKVGRIKIKLRYVGHIDEQPK